MTKTADKVGTAIKAAQKLTKVAKIKNLLVSAKNAVKAKGIKTAIKEGAAVRTGTGRGRGGSERSRACAAFWGRLARCPLCSQRPGRSASRRARAPWLSCSLSPACAACRAPGWAHCRQRLSLAG